MVVGMNISLLLVLLLSICTFKIISQGVWRQKWLEMTASLPALFTWVEAEDQFAWCFQGCRQRSTERWWWSERNSLRRSILCWTCHLSRPRLPRQWYCQRLCRLVETSQDALGGSFWLLWEKIQTHVKFKRTLFVRTKQRANFRGSHLYQATTHLKQLNGAEWDVELGLLFAFGWAVLFSCQVLGRMLFLWGKVREKMIKWSRLVQKNRLVVTEASALLEHSWPL